MYIRLHFAIPLDQDLEAFQYLLIIPNSIDNACIMSCTRDATVKAAVRFAPLLAFLLLSLVGFNLCLTILKEVSRLKGRRLDIQVPRCHETQIVSISQIM